MNDIFNRTHPEYRANQTAWERARDAYSGGPAYIDMALIKHVSEIDLEFAERKRRAYYFNYPRNIAQRITQYALSVDPVREGADRTLVEDWNRRGLRTNEVMRQLSTLLNLYGSPWLYVATPAFEGSPDAERVKKEKLRPFCLALSPLAVVDWAYGSDGELQWAIIEEEHVYDLDPFTPRQTVKRRRLWTREEWRLYEKGSETFSSGANQIGRVPLIRVTEPDGFGIDAAHWFEDVVRISDAILNNESEAQMNVVKQMFGMLVVSDSFARGAKKMDAKDGSDSFAAVVARSAAAWETTDEKGITRYVSPSGVETQTIRSENANLKQELYDTVGLAIQSRSKEAQTAESKAWDFQNVTQFLANRADLLEQAELEAWELMKAWDASVAVPKLTYNRQFAVRNLEASISALTKLSTLPNTGIEFQREIVRGAVELIDGIKSISDEAKAAILKEVDEMQPAPVPEIDFGGGVDNPPTNRNPEINPGDDKE